MNDIDIFFNSEKTRVIRDFSRQALNADSRFDWILNDLKSSLEKLYKNKKNCKEKEVLWKKMYDFYCDAICSDSRIISHIDHKMQNFKNEFMRVIEEEHNQLIQHYSEKKKQSRLSYATLASSVLAIFGYGHIKGFFVSFFEIIKHVFGRIQ